MAQALDNLVYNYPIIQLIFNFSHAYSYKTDFAKVCFVVSLVLSIDLQIWTSKICLILRLLNFPEIQ